jgi:hypothetical protein
VQQVGPTIPCQLPQLNDACSPHAHDRLGGRLWHHQPDHTPPRTPSLAHPSSNIVGIGSVLTVTLVGDSVLSRPIYLNDVLLAPDLVQSPISVRHFTTDNSCSMDFNPFGFSVKDLATRHMLVRYDSIGPLYTLHLPTSTAPTPACCPVRPGCHCFLHQTVE